MDLSCNNVNDGTIKIHEPITKIKNDSFKDCYGLKSLKIPKTVTSIGESAFSESGLTSLTFEEREGKELVMKICL